MENIESCIKELRGYIEEKNFKGYDPYDALNSSLLGALSFNTKWLRILYIQSFKRFPVNLRPLFGVKKDYNPKGLGLFLWGYSKLYKVEGNADYLRTIHEILDLLEKLKSNGYSGNCWGYNFDWQSRAFYIPKYTPTIVNSSFIGHALIDTYLHAGEERALEMAISIANFILKDLNRKEEGKTFCFSYTPIDQTFVHNANLLGASLLIRLYRYTKSSEHRDAALASLAYSMRYQREDGSWHYAETDFQKWIDSFHTGFNLQSILYFIDEGFAAEHADAFYKGVKFYADNFFLEDGTPKYYHDRVYPIDIHSPSQAVVFFSRMGERYSGLAKKVTGWMISNLQDKKGYFYFQKKPYYINKISYMRWGQAWAFHALAEYRMFHG